MGSLSAAFDGLDPEVLRARAGAKWQVPPDGVLPASVADMDFPVAAPIVSRLRGAVAGDLGYPDWPQGASPLREAFASRMAERFGWCPDAARVREFSNVTQAVFVMIELLTQPGDAVAVHTPSFRPFIDGIARMNRWLVPIRMCRDRDGWTFDPDRLSADLASVRCPVLLLVNPHNPTGRVFTEPELRALADICERHDVTVIADEVHADIAFPGHRHIPFAALGPAAARRTVTITSASKAFNLAGLRCAACHIGPERLWRALASRPAELTGSVGILGVIATLAAWHEASAWLDGTLAYLDGNRRLVGDVLGRRMPAISCDLPEATYLAWLDCRSLGWGADPAAEFLRRARVQLSPGPDFGIGGDGFARLNFATSRPVLRRILDRIVRAASCS